MVSKSKHTEADRLEGLVGWGLEGRVCRAYVHAEASVAPL